ncbi:MULTISPECIES: phosphatidylinositol-specific phospholipase C1-like protein [Kribbella]|uniref:phosphatidylinositol-specific phospholipase C1-like protein n=1 Tax=Kribbella TaxID=182639 RepID=UPI001F5471F2|nr:MULTISPECIES: phosphatidylinositol-specific phospholipase C1-like protein [Kribbella]
MRKGYLVRPGSDEPMATVLANETSRIGIALERCPVGHHRLPGGGDDRAVRQ